MANETRKRLHKALNDAGYNIGDYDEFDRRMNNADDRESFFNAVSNAGYNLGSREDFEQKISPSKYKLKINGVDTPVSEREYQDFVSRHPKKQDGERSMIQKAADAFLPKEDFQTTLQRGQRTVEGVQDFDKFAGRMQQRQGLQVPKRVTVGETGNLQEEQHLNPETGELENTYITAQGNEHQSKAIAEQEQRKIDERERYDRWRREHPKEALLGDIDGQIAKLEEEKNSIQQDVQEYPTTNVNGVMYMNPVNLTKNNQARSDLQYAIDDLKEAKTRLQRSQQLHASSDFLGGIGLPFTSDWFNNWKNFNIGMWDALSNPSFYSFGTTDLGKARIYMRLKDKMERGEELTDQETALAMAGMSLAQAQQMTEMPHGYTAGETTMDMAPFMLQMAANPASGVGKAFARQAVKKFGRDGIKAVSARMAARLLGNIGEAAVLSNTLQAGSTAANILQRYTGDSFEFDDNGRLMIGHYEDGPDGQSHFVQGGEGLAQSIWEGEASSIIENFTELGAGGNINKFIGKMANSKAGRAIGLGYISDLVGKVGATPFARNMKKFMERTHWDGMIEEPLEEEYGIILNSLLTGDNKISDLWDSEQQADIFAGTMWFGGFMSGMNTAAYPFYRRKIKRELNRADIAGQQAFGEEWPVLKDGIDEMDDKQVADYMYSVKDDDAYSNDQKAALFAYVSRLKQQQGASVADMLMRIEGGLSKEETDIRNAYAAGEELTEPQDMNDAKNRLDILSQDLSDILSEPMMAEFEQNPIGALQGIIHNENWTEEEKQLAMDYVNARMTYDGMINNVRDDIDSQIAQSDATIDQRRNQDDLQVHPATTKNGQKVYVISGNVVMNADGTGVDREATMATTGGDGMILAIDEATGKMASYSVDDFQSADAPMNADEMKQENAEAIRQTIAQQAANKIQGKLSFVPGETYTVMDEQGQEHSLQVFEDQGDGTVAVYVDGNPQVQVMATDTIQQMADNYNKARVASETEAMTPITDEGGETPATDQGETTTQQPTALSQIPVMQDRQGNPMRDKQGNPAYQWHMAPVETTSDALTEMAGGDMLMARDTASAMIGKAKGELEKARKLPVKGDDPITIMNSRKANAKAVEDAQALVKYWQDVNQEVQRRMREDEQRKVAEREAAKSEEQRAAEAEAQRQQQEKQAEIERERRREQIEKDRKERTRPYAPLERAKKEVKGDTYAASLLENVEPRDLQEWVSSLLRPHSFLWDNETVGEHEATGLQSELGLQKKDFDRLGKLLATRAEGGKPFAEVVDEIREGLPEGMKEQYTDQDVRNTLLSLFQEGDVNRMMRLTEEHRIEEARQAVAEAAQREAEAEMEAWAESYHLTPEEREAFEDYLATPPTVIEQEVINQILSEYEDRRISEMDQQPVSRADAAGVEGSQGEVQQTAEAAGNGVYEKAVATGSEAAGGEQTPVDNPVVGATEREAIELMRNMEASATPDPQISLTPETWAQTFGLNNSLETPIGNVKMGEGQYQKFFDKSRSMEFGMAVETLKDPDVVMIEPSQAKEGQTTERPYSYIFIKTFDRNGEKIKYYASVTVQRDNMEVSVSSHYMKPAKVYERLTTLERLYTKETLLPNSSEWHLAEQQDAVPDLLPTQENNVTSEGKDTNNISNDQENNGKTSSAEEISAEEAKVDTNPTDAQKEAGNYQKGHIKVDGYDITIENPKGSVRSGVDSKGNRWETTMRNTYGYIRGTEGVDGDHIDVFLSDNPASGSVFVVDQVNPESGAFDEHKVMYGFASEEEAREAYLSNYSKGWQGLGAITEVSREEFKKWVESSHRKTKPFAEYKSVKTAAQEAQQNIIKQLGDLQDNGKQYEENKEDAYDLGMQFASTLPEGTTSKEALRIAAEALDANKAKGGVYALPFFDGVTGNINSAENYSNIANEGTESQNNELPLPAGWDRLPTYDINNEKTGETIKGLKTLLNENYRELLKAYSSYANSDRRSLVGLQQARTALQRELEQRAAKFKEWQDKYNIDKQGKISLDDLSRLFRDYNKNKVYGKLFDKVVEVAKQIGLDIRFDDKLNAAGSSNYDGQIRYNTGNITSSGYNYQDIATLILHELIHSVTQSTVAAQKSGGKYAAHLTDSQRKAAQQVIDVFYELKDWAEKNGFKDTYGFKSPHEMLAEMASPNFRNILKLAKTKEKKSVWEVLKDAFHGIFSLTKETDAEKRVANLLDNMIDNFSMDTFEDTKDYKEKVLWSPAKAAERTMMGVHNISEDKLRKVIKQGGLANPSLAVIDTKGGYVHTDYGAISLIPKASLIDAKTGRNAGTFTADAWTPTYPPVELVMKDKGWDKFFADLKDIRNNVDGGQNIASRLRVYMESYLDGRDPDALYWWYMHDRGMNPAVERYASAYDKKLSDRVVELTDGNERATVADLSDNAVKELVALYHEYKKSKGEEVKPVSERIEYTKQRINPNDDNKMRQLRLQGIVDDLEKYGEIRSNIDNFIFGVNSDAQRQGEVDDYTTFHNARKTVENEGDLNDYRKWLDEMNKRYGIEEKIFNGWTPSGNKKYIANTLENVSKYMKKQGLNGAMDWSSIGNWIAKVANKEKTLEGIRSQRKNLGAPESEHNAFHEKWGTLMHDIAIKMGNGDHWLGENRMTEALDHKDVASYVKREYGVDLSKEDKDTIGAFIKAVRTSFPTGYFETKFERPVYLNEFEVAVVPEGTSEDIVKALKDAGLDVRTYQKGNEGDKGDENRRQAVMDAVTGRDDILFRDDEDEQPIFYSNAMRAVNGIKQEKATSEQWLAMLQKNGGLKAGEDKWLGLSDWLKEQKGSVTKQDVLDYIRKNQIEVEETPYQEYFDVDNLPKMQEFREEYQQLYDKYDKERNAINDEMERFNQEMYDKYGQGWANDVSQLSDEDRKRYGEITKRYDFLNDNDIEELAFADMVESYGDDFSMAFEVNYGNGKLEPQMDMYGDDISDAAKHFLEFDVQPINSTRLSYTTDGLENKKEIALTVPTIEPYNEGDQIHFGDADNGRAVAWIRFGDTVVKVGVESKVVTEFEAPYRNANGMEVYYPEGEKYGGRDYIVHGKIRTGEDKYVIVMHGKQVAAYDTFDEARDAMNQWYKDNNVGNPVTAKVLVIDEIQSKRHQDGREKGYAPGPEEATRLAKKAADDYRAAKTEEEKADAKQRFDYYSEYSPYYAKGGSTKSGVPDAPFDKNWHELAMKRMLRYAAENGYDKIAWTTGEQQAERYNIGNVVEKIISYDYPEVNDSDGRKTKKIEVRLKNGETMTMRVAQNGMVIEGRSDTEGKNLADVVGKDLAKRIMGGEGKDGTIFDANKDLPAKVIEGDGLRIGAEGMAGFYDEILPRFMNKYGKKWGVKVEKTELPDIGQTMWSIDVTPEMKESVMQGQPMFREGEQMQATWPSRKMTAKERRTKEAYAQRQWRRAHDVARDTIAKLRMTDKVEVRETAEGLTGRYAKAKGWYDKDSGKVVIILNNHNSPADVMMTILHECVAHYGLRQLFGKNFDQFLKNVYDNASFDIKVAIVDIAAKQRAKDKKYGRKQLTNEEYMMLGTEEYLASLAENTDFERANNSGWFQKIKKLFLDMLDKIGLNDFVYKGREATYGDIGLTLTDNELRYILWRSYKNLAEPGTYRNVFQQAEDIAMQVKLKVGNYKERERIQKTGRTDTGRAAAEADVVEMPKGKRMEEGVPKDVKTRQDEEAIYKKVSQMSLKEAKETFKRLDDMMRDEQGRDLDEQFEAHKWEYREKNGLNGIGKFMADDLKAAMDKYGSGMVELRWELMDRIEELGGTTAQEPNGIFRDDEDADRSVADVATSIYEDAVKDTGDMMMVTALWNAIKDRKEMWPRFKHKFAESWFDYTRSIKAIQDAIEKATGRKIRGFEDVWRSLNAKSSIDNVEINAVMDKYIAPLSEHVANMIKGKKMNGKELTIDDVEKYMNAVHGPERNIQMAHKQAQDEYDEDIALQKKQLENGELNDSQRKSLEEALLIKEARFKGIKNYMRNSAVANWYNRKMYGIRNAYNNGTMTEEDYKKVMDKMQMEYNTGWQEKYRNKDYAGLTALFKDELEAELKAAGRDEEVTEEMLEEAARKYAAEFENAVGKDQTDEMWDRVKALNTYSLRKSYLSGLISKQQYDDTLSMYEHYIPLRGWHDNYAGDVYQYISRGEPAEVLQGVLRKAYGRKSRAARIFGTMAAMANTSIVQGNKNIVAQKLLNLAMGNTDAGLLMVTEQWYQKDANDNLTPLFPELRDDMTAEEMLQALQDFEEDMKERQERGEVEPLRKKFKKEFPLNMAKWQEQRHAVRVLRNGKEYMVYVLGNPRAAEAFNGMLNPHSQLGAISNVLSRYMRFRAKWQTSLSPEFLISNFQRDVMTAATGAYVKFGKDVQKQFVKNLAKVMPFSVIKAIKKGRTPENAAGIFSLLHKYDAGTLNKDNDMERWFAEFVDNGGMTGISYITRAEEYQASMEEIVKRMRQGKLAMPREISKAVGDAVEFANKGIENATRFAMFMTSRQQGKTIVDSIFDAKEASVNFNMKGSGAWGNMMARRLYLYVNPAMQALRMLGTWYENDPVVTVKEGAEIVTKAVGKRFMKAAALTLGASVGCAVLNILFSALLGHGSDDDDDEMTTDWWGLSEWNRYNYINIVNPFGKGYLHWSIPQELRPLWATGQIAVDAVAGKVTAQHAFNSMLAQLNNLSPLSFFEGGTSTDDSTISSLIRTFTPTAVGEFTDAYGWNRDFMGHRITNQTSYNETLPEWQRALDSTPGILIQASRSMNEALGGRYNKRSRLESRYLNPSALYYIFTQQYGGIGTMVKRTAELVQQSLDPEQDVEIRNLPILPKLYVSTGDDYSKERMMNEKFQMYWDEFKGADTEMAADRRKVASGEMAQEEADKTIKERKNDGTYNTWKVIDNNNLDKIYEKVRGTKQQSKVRQMIVDAVENGDVPDYDAMLTDPKRGHSNKELEEMFTSARVKQIESQVEDMKSEEVMKAFNKSNDPRMRKALAKRISKDAGASSDPYGDKPLNDWQRQYQMQRTAQDVYEDALLSALQDDLRDKGYEDQKKELSKQRADVHKNIKGLTGRDAEADAERMKDLRSDRRKLLEQYNLK